MYIARAIKSPLDEVPSIKLLTPLAIEPASSGPELKTERELPALRIYQPDLFW